MRVTPPTPDTLAAASKESGSAGHGPDRRDRDSHIRLAGAPRRSRLLEGSPLSLLRVAALAPGRRPRHVAAVRALPARRPARRDGALLPAARARLRPLPARPAPAVRQPPGDLQRVRLLLLVLVLVGGARPPLLRADDRPVRARAAEPGGRAGQQRRLPAQAPGPPRHPRTRRRAGPQRRRGGDRRGCAHHHRVLRARAGQAAGGRGPARRPAGRQQRAGAGPRPQRLRGRDAGPAGAARGRHGRVPASCPPVRGQPVRHHLPRALLVLLAAGGRARLRRARAGRLRRGGAAHPRGIAAGVPAPRRGRLQAGAAVGGRRRGPRGRRGLRAAGALPFVRSEGRGDQAQAAQLPHRGQGPRPADGWLRRSGQGQHPAELLRHPHRPARLHGRPQSLQAGALPARHARARPRPLADRPDQARLRPDPAVEPEGRGRRAARRGALLGRPFRGPDPRGHRAVKTVLFCGGLGLRLREVADFRRRDTVASFLSVQPDYPFSLVDQQDGLVTGISDVQGAGLWVNGGYFIFRRDIFDYLDEGEELVVEPFQRLVEESKLITYPHTGFWAPMDTLVDHQTLEKLANGPLPLWAGWQGDEPLRPRGQRLVGQLLQRLVDHQRVHRRPEAGVRVGDQLALLDQPLERLDHQLLTLVEIVEDVPPEDEVAAVDPQPGALDVADAGDQAVLLVDERERVVRLHAQERGDGVAAAKVGDQLVQGRVGQAVAVAGEEDLLAFEVLARRPQPLADVGLQSGVGEGDPPVVDVAGEQLDLAAAVAQHEVVGDGLVVVQEVLLDHVGLVAEAQDEVPVPVVRVVLHDVPQDRPVADRDHRLGDRVGVLAQPQAQTATEKDGFHSTVTSGIGTTKRPPQERTSASCATTSSFRFHGRIRT